MKLIASLILLSLSLITVQACSSPTSNSIERDNKDSIMPKEFGDRFSAENIKKEREAFYAQKRLELKRTSPTAEVNKALRSNNIYLMEVPGGRGSEPSLPGLTEPKPLQVNCKTVTVEGMGDVLYGKNHMQYRQELLAFIREFNALMAPKCK